MPTALSVFGLSLLLIVLAARWVQATGPLAGFDDMATVEEMGVSATSGKPGAADEGRCKVPDFAKAIGHEDLWKKHNGCS